MSSNARSAPSGQQFRICWIATGLANELTGIERLLVDCVTQLDGEVDQTVLVHPEYRWTAAFPSGARIVPLRRRQLEIARTPRIASSLGPFDLVHSFGPPFPRLRGAQRSYTVHDWGPFRDHGMPPAARIGWSTAIARGIRFADRVHLYSRTVAEEAPTALAPALRRKPVLFGLPSAPAMGPAPDEPRDRSLVLTVGSDVPRKRFALLASAVTRSQTLRLSLAGNGTDLRGDGDRVAGLGRVTDDELRVLYARAGTFALMSSYEGFGLPVLEAWMAGCRIVITEGIAARLPSEIVHDAIVLSSDPSPAEVVDALERAARLPAPPPARHLGGRGVLVERILSDAGRSAAPEESAPTAADG